jgi:hypothetical protein
MDPNPSDLKNYCWITLRYFGIFRYPMALDEIHKFTQVKATPDEIDEALKNLLEEGRIFQSDKYFMPENDNEWISERMEGNERAYRLLEKAGKYVRIIASFPFVKGIAISGSLSKFYARENPDIDYFIITSANRLWIARTLLHLFKKFTFLTGHQHYFCMNYFIDTEALEITHPNLYTAIEVATLLPVYNKKVLKQFETKNQWFKGYLPNHPGMVNYSYIQPDRKSIMKKMSEGFLNLLAPVRINNWFMRVTDRKWRRKWRRHGYPDEDYNRAFLTNLHISKNHPVDYEKKVMSSLAEYQEAIEEKS